MKKYITQFKFLIFVFSLLLVSKLQSQQVQWPKEQILSFTSQWKGERFNDGRPKVPDNLVKKAC